MKKLTAVIPTLLKDMNVLNQLIHTLIADESVQEIILINNSDKEYLPFGDKLRVISLGKNLFVNPSWNLGVKEAKSEYIALINDDIKIPENLCSKILEKMDDNTGILGMDTNFVINTRDKENNVIIDTTKESLNLEENAELKPITFRPPDFGIMMVFKKEIFVAIPEDLKIFFGDDWMIKFAARKGKTNVVYSGQKIFHCGSLSSNAFCDWAKQENRIYKKHIIPFWKRLLYFYKTCNHYIFYVLGLNFSVKKKK